MTVNAVCKLALQARIDPSGLDGRFLQRRKPKRECDGILHWESPGGLCWLGVAYLSTLLGDDSAQGRWADSDHDQDVGLTQYEIDAEPGKQYVLRQMASLVPSLLHSEPHWQASRMVQVGSWYGFDELRAANRAEWARLWKGRPVILGAEPAGAIGGTPW